jgi:hypothetical protein
MGPSKKVEDIIERALREVYLKPTRPTLTPPLVDHSHRRVLEGRDRISRVDECALARVGGPLPVEFHFR